MKARKAIDRIYREGVKRGSRVYRPLRRSCGPIVITAFRPLQTTKWKYVERPVTVVDCTNEVKI